VAILLKKSIGMSAQAILYRLRDLEIILRHSTRRGASCSPKQESSLAQLESVVTGNFFQELSGRTVLAWPELEVVDPRQRLGRHHC